MGIDFFTKLRHLFVMNVIALPRLPEDRVSFDRQELTAILSVYGRFVAAGLWRDYAIVSRRDHAIFAIFRRTSEAPLYRVEKRPALLTRDQLYALIGSDGRVLKRGGTLTAVLAPLERKLLRTLK